ncbi:MAG TPA: hypothetical protein VJ813_00830 [Vicinamibacterales bacterium]|nr:hypothetical protein [Vicinamibacterales bacterium]
MARRFACLIAATFLALPLSAAAGDRTLDAALTARAQAPRGTSRVIITTTTGGPAGAAIAATGATAGRFLPALGQVALVPDTSLRQLAARPEVLRVTLDSPYLGRAAGNRPLGWALEAYWRLVQRALRVF